MRYLYRRGNRAKRRVMHLCGYDPRTGKPSMRALCDPRQVRYPPFDTTCNVPLGGPICKRCAASAALQEAHE